MFKRYHQVFTALRILLDVAMVVAAFAGAYAIRFGSPRTFPYPELPPLRETLTVGALAVVLWPLVLRSVGLYRPQRHKSALDEVFGVFKATVLAGLVLGAGRLARQALEQIEVHRELGFRPVGCLSLSRARVGQSVDGTLVIGTVRALREVLRRQQIDQVLVALPSRSFHHLPRIMEICADTTVDVKLVPDVYQYATLF